ncbi:MAG: MFS transporter [Chloroflexi bacterium]|nr:MFS transporter [Chloroflexota bacterium]
MLSSFSSSKKQLPFFYGWVIVAVCGLIVLVSFGIRLSFTVFFVALLEEFNWTRADTAFIFSVSMIVFTVTSTWAGMMLDRWGVHRLFTAGAVLLALGLWFSSRVQSLMQLAIAYGIVVGLGITILGLGLQASVVSRWFRKKLGLAIGLTFAGTGIGTLVITPAAEYLVSQVGWRTAYLVLAGLAVAIIPFILLFLRLSPEEMGLQPDGNTVISNRSLPQSLFRSHWTMSQVVRTPSFWLLIVASLGAVGPIRMLTVHQLAAMVDAGFDHLQGATIIGLTGGITAVSFVVWGILSDRFGRQGVYALGSFCLLGAIGILGSVASFSSPNILFVYALLLGLGEGSRSSLVTAVASDIFPGNALSTVNGAIGAAFGAGAAFFPWLAGWLFDFSGSYKTAFQIGSGAVLISLIALWLAVTRTPKHLSKRTQVL